MTQWFERLRQAMERLGIDADEVAKRAGVPRKSIYGYLDGIVANPRGDVMSRLAKAVGMTESELRYGASYFSVVYRIINVVPLSAVNKALTLAMATELVGNGDTMSAPDMVPGDSFGVRVDNGMGTPEINQGDILICSPSADVEPGKLVVAIDHTSKMAVFGRYKAMSLAKRDCFVIEPVNRAYPDISIQDDTQGFVLARVVMHIRHT